jgi:hypothetical protein
VNKEGNHESHAVMIVMMITVDECLNDNAADDDDVDSWIRLCAFEYKRWQ